MYKETGQISTMEKMLGNFHLDFKNGRLGFDSGVFTLDVAVPPNIGTQGS